MSDTEKEPVVTEQASSAPDVETLKAENFAQREKRRAAEARIAELEPMAAKLAEYEAAQKTEAERTADELKAAREEAQTAKEQAEAARRDAAFGLAIAQYNVDPSHLPVLNAAKSSLPYSDPAALEAMLAPYQRKASAPNHKVIDPPSGNVPSLANLDSLSINDRLSAYGDSLKGKQ